MKKNSLDIYKEQIKEHYELAKEGFNSEYLINPSPARLRDLCILLFDKGLENTDKEIFIKFFGGETNDILRQIKKVDIGKLKPIQRFFLNSSDLTILESINLAAVLVAFRPRPYLRFKEAMTTSKEKDLRVKENGGNKSEKSNEVKELRHLNDKTALKTLWGKLFFAVGILLLVVIAGVGIIQFYDTSQCMTWKTIQFETVDCDDQPQGEVIPYDKELMDCMKKIYPTPETTFFKDGEPIVWYSKQDNNLEFFTCHGLHPVTGVTLKAVTKHIVQKYVTEVSKR